MGAGGDTAFAAIERSALAIAMRQELWLYPSVQILHILGFVLLVGAIALVDFRLLGLSRRLPVRELLRHATPWTFGALLVIVPTGLLMFLANATDLVANRAFVTKIALIFAAGVNAAAFYAGPWRTVGEWGGGAPPFAARLHAALSLAIWTGVIACGRLLAYL